MDLQALQKAIHDTAMTVRKGDWSQYDKLQELRALHREMTGVVQPEAPKAPEAAAPEAPEKLGEDKRSRRQKRESKED